MKRVRGSHRNGMSAPVQQCITQDKDRVVLPHRIRKSRNTYRLRRPPCAACCNPWI
jgi:hypothetical protein